MKLHISIRVLLLAWLIPFGIAGCKEAPSEAPAPLPVEAPPAEAAEVLPGVEVLVLDFTEELAGNRVGIVTNPTGVT